MGKPHRRQHRGLDVLCAMLGLTREIDDLRLAPFVLGDVASDFAAPTTLPSAFLIGETVREMSINLPCLHCRTVS
ncbi:hypothetical protein [Bradyrhizobium sp. LTSPM299]|jgi:hypothetical protein|uniref:hypothetical protein n=1 Tax=Bradyrhizobium sp. LTSPM299 TaxID=1619233 RepID=UPI0012E1E482|nr:hypothetical protein [Bradyrhizobium sp. LTSPM299]